MQPPSLRLSRPNGMKPCVTWSEFVQLIKKNKCAIAESSQENLCWMGAQSHERHHRCFTVAKPHSQAGGVTASIPAALAVLAHSFSWQPPRALGKAAVLVLPQPLPFLMKDESSLLLKIKVLSPACYRPKCLFWQPPYAAIRQKRNLSEKR